MAQRLLFIFLFVSLIIVSNLWHHFARWFVHTQSNLSGLLLLAIVLLLCVLFDPYCD